MSDPLGNYVPDTVKNDEPMREPIAKLGKLITDRAEIMLGKEKITKESPEYWGLANICTDEQAEIALKMGKRKPKTFAQIKKVTGIQDDEYLQKQLDEMSWNGLIEYNWENPQHEKQYVLPMYVPGSAEFTNMNKDVLEAHPELGRFFERMSRLPLEKITPMVPLGGAGIGMHVIPVEKAIEMENKSVSVEHISHWLDKYEGKYAASPCSCRRSRTTYDEGCADDPEGWCIAVGDMADYCVETGKGGRYISKEEVLKILQKAEDNGFVHQITNIDGEDKIFAICNCNVNVCYALRTSQLFNTPNMSRSAYVAHVEKEKCVACGRCVEFCPAGAVSLGQKLCKKDGSEVTYPKQELPDATKWGEDKWDEDYRDKNRINCHDTGTSPCKTACPAHIAVQGYLKMASQGRYKDALALIKKENPFPAVCGRICNKRCEDACTRGMIDRAVSIDAVKKFIAAKDLEDEHRYVPEIVVASNRGRWKEKVAIIGGGPAGLSCAFYLAQMGYYPTVFEKNEKPGGMLTYGIPSYKLEKDVIDAEIEIMKEMGVEIRTGVEVGKDVTIPELRNDGYKAFYVAVGCQGGRYPNIPNDHAEGTQTAVEFLKEANTGKCHFEDETVVVGGGNVAIDAARVSARSGAKKVTMLCLESKDIMPASDEEIREAEEDGVVINCGWGPKEVVVENGKVTAVIFKKCTRVYDENKKFSPLYDENETITVPATKIIFAIGQSIEWGSLLDGTKVEFWHGNYPVADKLTYQTAEEDIFVGGDVYTGPKFAIDAIAAGHEAAESLHRYVQHGHMTIGRNRREFIELDKNDLRFDSYDTAGRQEEGMRTDVDPHSFSDAHATLTEEQVKKETSRCLGCGATIVDQNRCIGCGLCTTKCKFDAITLHRDHPEASKMVVAEDKFKYILPYTAKRAVKIVKKKKENK